MLQQACPRASASQQPFMQVDLSCSESGEDLSNGFDSPCWPSAEAGITRIHTRSHTPPIAMEVHGLLHGTTPEYFRVKAACPAYAQRITCC